MTQLRSEATTDGRVYLLRSEERLQSILYIKSFPQPSRHILVYVSPAHAPTSTREIKTNLLFFLSLRGEEKHGRHEGSHHCDEGRRVDLHGLNGISMMRRANIGRLLLLNVPNENHA
jgi:hypothetical protein